MPRGGKRAGAGAPIGNLNALKHGGTSILVQTLMRALAKNPATRDALLRMRTNERRRRKQAEKTAAVLLGALIKRATSQQINQPNDGNGRAPDTENAEARQVILQQSKRLYERLKSIIDEDGSPRR